MTEHDSPRRLRGTLVYAAEGLLPLPPKDGPTGRAQGYTYGGFPIGRHHADRVKTPIPVYGIGEK